jgi:curved DNA-binding protein CbpA
MSNYYEILGLDADASVAQIKAAYKKLAQKYHPDKNKDAGTEHMFANIKRAYDVLSNPNKRRSYDAGDSNYEVDITRKAVEIIAQGISQFIKASIEDGGLSPKFSELSRLFSEHNIQSKREVYQINSRLKKLDKMAGKVKIKNHDDLYDNIYSDIRRGLIAERAKADENVLVYGKAVEILEGAIVEEMSESAFVAHLQHAVDTGSVVTTEWS